MVFVWGFYQCLIGIVSISFRYTYFMLFVWFFDLYLIGIVSVQVFCRHFIGILLVFYWYFYWYFVGVYHDRVLFTVVHVKVGRQ